MELMVPLDGSAPLYRQVYSAVREAILEGRLAPGEQLPATRRLADRLDVSRTVVLEAYRQLRTEGYATAEMGSGTYVADVLPEDMLSVRPGPDPEAPSSPVSLDRPGTAVDRIRRDHAPPAWRETGREPAAFNFLTGWLRREDFPTTTWRRLLADHVRDARHFYGHLEGHPALREAVAAYARRARAVRCDAEQVVIVDGTRQCVDIVARALLRPGDRVVIEEPHYGDVRYPLSAAGGELVGVDVDGDGLRVDELPADADDVRLAYVAPSHQFPSGGVMPLARRVRLLSWAQEHDVFLVEDDYDAEFQYEARPVEALQALDREGRVLYVGTFSKVLSPDLRLAYAVVPDALRAPFLEAKWLVSRQTPTPPQAALAEFMTSGGFDRHLRRMRKRYEGRRQALLEALRRTLGDRVEVVGANAGVHVLVRVEGLHREDVPELVRRAEQEDVSLYGAAEHYLSPPERGEILLGYSAMEEADIRAGVERLAPVVEEVAGR